jgi:2-polyprenyl-3-methyl-5-hydroxy-6-metoxy-1,4-benzoquinol methylase
MELKTKAPILTQLRALTREDFEDLPQLSTQVKIGVAPPLKISLLIPAREASSSLEQTVEKAHDFLSSLLTKNPDNTFEIILIPNPAPYAEEMEVMKTLVRFEHLASRFPGTRIVSHLSPPDIPGKGSALRSGFVASQGRLICFTDSDLPYDLDFFEQAFVRVAQGYDLITGNRRMSESRFDIPVSVLPFAYNRHRLGLLFNRVVRALIPVGTTDTQAGIKVLSRRLAEKAFGIQRCPGFFFDLEIFLVNRANGWAQAEIPVSLHLNSEKSTVRIIRESVLAVYWLARITLGNIQGHYGKKKKKSRVLRQYWGVKNISPVTRLFLFLRWGLTPYALMAKYLPPSGKIVDYGCGHGLFGMSLAQESAERKVFGIDHDRKRIEIALEAARSSTNLQFSVGGLFESAGEPAKGISLIDVMHYFDPVAQKDHLASAFNQLDHNGILIFREVDPDAGFISVVNRFYEKIATSIGFTRSNEEKLYFRKKEDWLRLLAEIGFHARAERCSSILFADVLFIGEKP